MRIFAPFTRGCDYRNYMTHSSWRGKWLTATCMAAAVFGIVREATAQSVNHVLADAARPARIRPIAQVAAEQTAAPTMFPHPDDTRYFIAGQANIIFQAHGPFHSPYEGTNSLLGRGEYKRR